MGCQVPPMTGIRESTSPTTRVILTPKSGSVTVSRYPGFPSSEAGQYIWTESVIRSYSWLNAGSTAQSRVHKGKRIDFPRGLTLQEGLRIYVKKSSVKSPYFQHP
jgi:hypothetical protein